MKYYLLFVFSLLMLSAYSQTGSIQGNISDTETGETLIGATVMLAGTTTGAAGDLDGNFTISNIKPGTYKLVCNFISYQPDTLKNIVVKAGEITTVNFKLETIAVKMDEVVIQARANKAGQYYMLNTKQESAVLLDGITSKEIARGGDSDVAGALKRVTGVSVEGGKYVYVRGLSDRYSKTTLNAAVIPSLDPRRNAVQMDMFPVSMVDNISVYKTFSPDLPGDFSGGLVDISTKDYPDNLVVDFSVGLEYNTNATFNDNFIGANSGNSDWKAKGSDDRAVPDVVRENDIAPVDFSSFEDARMDAGLSEDEWNNLSFSDKQEFLQESRIQRNETITDQTKSFNKAWNPEQKKAGLNQSYNLAIGDKISLFNNDLGFNVGFNYASKNKFYNDGVTGRYTLTGNVNDVNELTTQRKMTDTRGDEARKWGALFNMNYALGKNNLIGFNFLHNQNGLNSGRFQEGINPSDDVNLFIRVNSGRYIERSMDTYQIKGEHTIKKAGGMIINWQYSKTESEMITPDLRVFTNDYTVQELTSYFDADGNDITNYVVGEELSNSEIEEEFPGFTTFTGPDTLFNVSINLYPAPTRYYRNMHEINNHAYVNIKIPFNRYLKGLESSVKFGGTYVDKSRQMDEIRYSFISQGIQYNGNDSEYFDDSNMNVVPGNNYLYLRDDTELRNSYRATENNISAYAMVDWKPVKKLRIITGARIETTDLKTQSLDTAQAEGLLDRTDVLPALSLKYELNQKNNLRFSGTRTLARPTFRELAPFANFDFEDGFVYVGNTELDRTLIDNLDLRWEIFPKSGEIISVSAFYKKFHKPIEKVVNPEAQNVEITWENVEQGQVIGLEFEFRKNLDFITHSLRDFSLGLNVTIVKSETSIDPDELEQIRSQDPNHIDTREMFGQAPYVINAYLTYLNRDLGLELNTTYNVIGPRMTLVVKGGTPNVFEQPFHLLNFNVSKTLGKHFGIKLSASNILNSRKREIQTYKDVEYDFQSYTRGTTFGVTLKYSL